MGERVQVDSDALDALIAEAETLNEQSIGEYCVGADEGEACRQELRELIAALEISHG